MWIEARYRLSETPKNDSSSPKTVEVKKHLKSGDISFSANPGTVINGSENLAQYTSSANDDEIVAMASGTSSDSVGMNDQLAPTNGRNAMSLTTLLQPPTVSPDQNNDVLSTSLDKISKKRKLDHESTR